ncbi:Universal stress protein [Sporotomaculum syntrophicum]|uniref:Universal stress protein n=1 Tax=Sporotomaculum syntrophicum TaxID=182264 RepID=A0A9D3AZT7_9FIRM|nr:universal stress protein [Sporotomaculum syntrophicum]KAF1086249.1 Universal stress protein [Sporotomaculum syntrophicum]
MFERIIVVPDLSDDSLALVERLGALKAYGVKECLLLHCLDARVANTVTLSYISSVMEINLKAKKEVLEKHGYTVETRIAPGLARKMVNKIALEEDYSLIVVGAHKHSFTSETPSDGVAYDVIHYARKPVLVVRLEDEYEPDTAGSFSISDHILCPTDFSENAEQAFEYLLGMASKGVKKITLMHVQDQTISKYLGDRLDELNRIDDERLQNLKQRLQSISNAEVNTEIKHGNPSVEVLKTVQEIGVQLVIMGSQGRGFVKELFLGSVSHNIVRQADASVLLIPARREIAAAVNDGGGLMYG